jgi:hypothetical protein
VRSQRAKGLFGSKARGRKGVGAETNPSENRYQRGVLPGLLAEWIELPA